MKAAITAGLSVLVLAGAALPAFAQSTTIQTTTKTVTTSAPAMVQTSARLLALLSLLQVRREWTGQELADRLEVGPRTIRRDVDKLRSLGYPVEAAPGVAGGYPSCPLASLPSPSPLLAPPSCVWIWPCVRLVPRLP